MESEFKVGDEVALSAQFLRSIADYSYESASKRFRIIETMDWNMDSEGPSHAMIEDIKSGAKRPVAIKNLVLVKDLSFEASL